ncbi:MAG: DUF3365 domain-containing protein [Magnetospirillum sp.]|nr:MAG: DUF3365 domain-containing protein [Magnetospirillum sp.]
MLRFAPLPALCLVLASVVPAVAADDLAPQKAEATAIVKEYGGRLQGELKAAMESGGPVAAITVCNQRSPAIAADMSARTGWMVARTSLKPRNSASAPTVWEEGVMRDFERRIAAGEPVADLARAEVVEEGGAPLFRFAKAVPTAELCLNCHGSELKPETQAALRHLYPTDTATGFKVGDMRGIFSLSKRM